MTGNTDRARLRPLPFLGAGFLDSPAAMLPAVVVPAPVRNVRQAELFAAELQGLLARNPFAAQVIEWRVDALCAAQAGDGAPLNPELLAAVAAELRRARLPLMATLRTRQEGGGEFDAAGSDYTATVSALFAHADAVDIEHARPDSLRLVVAARDAGVTPVLSHHDWERTPLKSELRQLFFELANAGAGVAKLAVTVHSAADTAALQAATAEAARTVPVPVIGIAMGELGRVSRLLGAGHGSAATFGVLHEATAPGQLSLLELSRERQRLGSL